jgi:glycosyltransferase involved in cell wall biosynthesis
LAQKIIQLLDDPALRIKMGRFGRNRVESELEWKYEVPRLLAAYDLVFTSGQYPHKGQ